MYISIHFGIISNIHVGAYHLQVVGRLSLLSQYSHNFLQRQSRKDVP